MKLRESAQQAKLLSADTCECICASSLMLKHLTWTVHQEKCEPINCYALYTSCCLDQAGQTASIPEVDVILLVGVKPS